MRMGRLAGVSAACLAGFVAGAVVTLSLQGRGEELPRPGRPGRAAAPVPTVTPEAPQTFLMWTPGGLPPDFGRRLARLPRIVRSVVVASDNTWMSRSYSAQGQVVDDPTRGYKIPLEVAAVEPQAYAPFLPPADRSVVVSLAAGQGVLGQSSARLRRLGPGALLQFGRVKVRIAAILPDELVGAQELMVSRRVGRTIGVVHDRYALLQPSGHPTDRSLRKQLHTILPAGLPVQVRAPGETPYFRQGDAVLPPVQIKLLFGEFAAKPDPARRGYLLIDPAWERTHIVTERVPILGRITCNAAIFPQVRGVMRELLAEGLAQTIHSYSGCYARRYSNRDPRASISHHTWGIALDLNVGSNPYGAPPHQSPRLVAVFEKWGFIWGGRFIVPDGMHFEYRRPAPTG
jgi:D-alanyl-D-alanine carboxypeptidase